MAAPKAPRDDASSFLTRLLSGMEKKKSDSKPVTEQQRVGKAMSDYDTEAYNVGASGKGDSEDSGQRNLNNATTHPRSLKAFEDMRTAQEQAGDKPAMFKKGGKIDFSQIIRNKKTGVLSMKKSTGGMVRGTGCAERGKGKGTVY
jgi:hypothetical protein